MSGERGGWRGFKPVSFNLEKNMKLARTNELRLRTTDCDPAMPIIAFDI